MSEQEIALWSRVYSAVISGLLGSDVRLEWERIRERATIEANLAVKTFRRERYVK